VSLKSFHYKSGFTSSFKSSKTAKLYPPVTRKRQWRYISQESATA